ncbi:dephospho-CoA kinase [Thermodesulfobacteriota bacterium]
MAKVVKIAVTGSAGSGKTSVCDRFRELGLKVISSDSLAREAVAPNTVAYEMIVDSFGKQILKKDGTLNRQRLRRMMISDDDTRKTLEQCIHPEINKLMHLKMAEAEKESAPVVIIEVPLLFEFGMESRFDAIIVVTSDRELQIRRMMNRDTVSRGEAKALLSVQIPDEEKIERSEFVIKNSGSPAEMIRSVDHIYKKIYQKYQKRIKTA